MLIDSHSYRSVKSYNSRIRLLVFHYTAADFAASVAALTNTVSAHYLVPDITDPSYQKAGFQQQQIFNLVDETWRAWHAGVSYWQEHTSLNDTSIGIEIVNLASERGGVFTFPPYNEQQIEAVLLLAQNIVLRYPDISPTAVVGHSDIAPYRKRDPGPAFPWHRFYQAGVGAWYDDKVKEAYQRQFAKAPLTKEGALQLLHRYGYDISGAETSQGFTMLIGALQMHFRPACYDGVLDVETMAVLAALVEKYCHQVC